MLTPIDIQNHSLKTAMHGYSKKETDEFLEEILADYEELYKENHELKEKISSLSDGIQYYKNMENTLQKALVLAEKTSAETQEAAKNTADAMLSEAQAKAEAIQKEASAYAEIAKSDANRELESTREHVRKLVQSYENYRLQFKKLAESQIEMLNSEAYSIFAPELEEVLQDAPSADEAMQAQETIGINNENALNSDPLELTEEEKMAETKDLSGILSSDTSTADVGDAAAAEAEPEVTKVEVKEDDTEKEWQEITPKVDNYHKDSEISESVSPEEENKEEEDSPFTFIDPES